MGDFVLLFVGVPAKIRASFGLAAEQRSDQPTDDVTERRADQKADRSRNPCSNLCRERLKTRRCYARSYGSAARGRGSREDAPKISTKQARAQRCANLAPDRVELYDLSPN